MKIKFTKIKKQERNLHENYFKNTKFRQRTEEGWPEPFYDITKSRKGTKLEGDPLELN